MSQKYVIACDLGTSGLKVVLVSTEGAVLAAATEPYPLLSTEPKMAEQIPDEYWNAACRGFRAVRGDRFAAEDCLGIAFGGQWRVIIPVDAEGSVLCNGTIWCDGRAGEEARMLTEATGRKFFSENDYWSRLAWFRKHRPEIYERCQWILEANAFLKWRATGRAVSDVTNSFTRSPSPIRQAFFEEVLGHAGISLEKFPPVCASTELVGGLTAEAAQQLDLPEGTPVFGGCCDIPAAAIGTGRGAPGDVHCSLGTSGWLSTVSARDEVIHTRPPLDAEHDNIFLGSLGIRIGPATNWIVDTLYGAEKERLGDGVWALLNEELAAVPPGCERLLAAPWIFGARKPLASNAARGVFVNLGSHHTRAHMAAALLEGVCFMLRRNLEQNATICPSPITSVTVCGGGAANPRWMQALADILRIDVNVPADARSRGAVGVAFCALIGLGIMKDFESVKDHIVIEKIYHPRPETFAEYELLSKQFDRLYTALEEIFVDLNGPATC